MISNSGTYRIPPGHLLSPNKVSDTGTRFYSIELFAKVVPWIYSKIPSFCQDNRLLLKNDNRAPLPTTTPTQFIKHGKVELV